MDRLSQLRGEAGASGDSTLDTTSPPSEAFITANESSSKFYSLSEVDSTFDISSMKEDISSIKDVSLANTSLESEGTMTNADELISNLSPIGKKSDMLDSYKIDTQIEAANILSGGVAIFDDNDNSYDGDELVIDDNVDIDEKSNSELKQPESLQFKTDENILESSLISEETDIASKDTEVVLQIDGKNVDAIDIGNGLYLYRKEGQEELAAVQIIYDDEQQPSFKFLKVRDNAEGNLEVYEEIEIEVPKEVPAKEGKTADKNTPAHVPIKDINKVISDSACNKVAERKVKTPKKEPALKTAEEVIENKETSPDNKSEVNLNGKMMKFSELRKSPVIGSFTPMTYHSTPNKEGKPLTKTMVDQQLHPNRHSDVSNVKKTIEVHTDNIKQKCIETPIKNKDFDDNKLIEISSTEKETVSVDKDITTKELSDAEIIDIKDNNTTEDNNKADSAIQEENESKMIVNEAKADIEKDKLVIEETVKQISEEKVFQINSEVDRAEEPMEVDDDDTLTIVENVPEVNIEVVANDSQILEDAKPAEPKESQKESLPIKDDDVNTVEAVAENEKKEKEKCKEQGTDVKSKEEVTDKKTAAKKQNILDIKKDAGITQTTKDIEVKESAADTTSSAIQAKPTKESTVDTPKDSTSEAKTPKEGNSSSLPVPTELKQDKVSAIIGTIAKVVKSTESLIKEPIASLIKPLIKEPEKTVKSTVLDDTPQEATQPKKVLLEDIQKPIEEPPKISENTQKQEIKLLNLAKDDQKAAEPIKLLEMKQLKAVEPPKIPEPKQQSDQLLKASVNTEVKTSKPSIVTQDKQSNKVNEPLQVKVDVPKEPTKHVAVANISPLLEQKQQSNIRVIQSKSMPEKNLTITALPIKNVNTNTYQKVENKTTAIPVSNVPQQRAESTLPEAKAEGPNKAVGKVSKPDIPSAIPQRKEPVKETLPNVPRLQSVGPATVAQGINKSEGGKQEIQKDIPKPTKNTIDKQPTATDAKSLYTTHKDQNNDISSDKEKGVMNIEITKVPKLDPAKMNVVSKQDVSSTSSKVTSQVKNKMESKDKKEIPRASEPKPINNNNAAVPFGKWTDANRQEFLNKFKTKASVTSSSSNQLKNSNDLNRRDVLKKIDSQRQSSNALSKTQEANKQTNKPETAAFTNKPIEPAPESKIPQKTETLVVKSKPAAPKNVTKPVAPVTQSEPDHKPADGADSAASNTELGPKTGLVQNLIDRTIEGMLHRTLPLPKSLEEPKKTVKEPNVPKGTKPQQTYQPIDQATLDAIEMQMNELHGIPFIERPPHELPQMTKSELKTYSKTEKEKPPVVLPKAKVPNLLPFPNKNQENVTKDGVIEVDSEDEIIEHEPITGDIDLNKKNQVVKPPAKEKQLSNVASQVQQDKVTDAAKKEAIITEKDFDKFARRNSITYENCLTVNIDHKGPPNVIQTVVEKDINPKSYSKNDSGRVDPKVKPLYKYQNVRANTQPTKPQPVNKFTPVNDDASNRNQSKLQKAYHSALTKRQMVTECPISIIEDKPVKVVFMDSVDYVPSQLNVQGQDLSPAKRPIPESDVTASTCDSLDSDVMDTLDDGKAQDEIKAKTKHQRKQVLTPVEEPELELIEPRDLGLEVSPKKKRRTEEVKTDKNVKYPMRKKIYLLGSNAVAEEKVTNPVEGTKNPLKESVNMNDNGVAHKNPVSALDSLVKAAELIETQTENISSSIVLSNTDSNASTPVKRGRGRPRKYPLTPDGTVDKSKVISAPSPQKKPRLIDAKAPKRDTFTDDSDSEGEIIKENWTMGKINENIVCPICNKLFRTENVVFKHVKHCTGPSPNRSDSDKRSPRRMRSSQDFDTKSRGSRSDDMDIDDDKPLITRKETPKKRKSKDSITKPDEKDEVIVIEDTPVKDVPAKVEERKTHESRKSRTKIPHKSNELVCEFCGKTFRQLSYLVSHKLQHKKIEKEKAEPKKTEKDAPVSNKSVYSCEVCKKEFRKLHHLVQHRIIHNPNTAPVRLTRKSSSEQSDNKVDKEPSVPKQCDDPSAGFRCEPCDKSFRKLHHLVEHRETHDGINRQKTTTVPPVKEEKIVEKPAALHQCDVCKKTFKKLQHLNEHKEQHVETSSEKSDDKSVQSCLSTRDIIHECSMCYMVFPNEHSLNKHTIICLRKKRQSKQSKPANETEAGDEATESPTPDEKIKTVESPITILEDSKQEGNEEVTDQIDLVEDIPTIKEEEQTTEKIVEPEIAEKVAQKSALTNIQQVPPAKRDFAEIETAKTEEIPVVPEKIKKVEDKVPMKVPETPKKKIPLKEKTAAKRVKATVAATPGAEEVKPTVESSDDDDVRYMLNPNFKEEVTEEKVFMKVRAKKRSSLQIERPNSKDLMKRRTSLQHPPKIPRLKPKAIEVAPTLKKEIRIPKVEPVTSTDSDDSETTKYSFPPTIPEKPTKPAQERTLQDSERKILKKTLADKRKSLSSIAKRKSLGKAVTARHKASPLKQVKKRTLDVEHRCDCGQLFSSAALLSRHTTLAHTPPRIRRRRSPPPEDKPVIKPAPRKSSVTDKPKQTLASRKSSARSDSSTSTNTKSTKSEAKSRKSLKDTESPSDRKTKTEKSEAKSSVKLRRTGAHRGVPVPEKMRKLLQKK